MYLGSQTKKWDTCPVEAFVMSLGGKFTAVDGSLLDYSEETQKNDFGLLSMMDLKKYD
jgi:3'-phosphoadenosine 5'-phosphosulfate (PAPS) 3'-phosphatase